MESKARRCKYTVLCVTDELQTLALVTHTLNQDGFDVITASKGADILKDSSSADLVLLDLLLPDMTGISVCKQLRTSSDVPIIILGDNNEQRLGIDRITKDAEMYMIEAFDAGADDYIAKPFSARELLARVRAMMRRIHRPTVRSMIRNGPITIDTENYYVIQNGKRIQMTQTEFALLMALASNPGKVQTKESLLQTVWGYGFSGSTRTLDTHIRKIRIKLGSNGDLIETVRSVGFKMRKV